MSQNLSSVAVVISALRVNLIISDACVDYTIIIKVYVHGANHSYFTGNGFPYLPNITSINLRIYVCEP